MKKIEAIIRSNKLNAVKSVLESVGVHGMTVTEVHGLGEQKGDNICYRGVATQVEFVPRMKIEIVVADDAADAIVDAIFQAAHTGEPGDGRILVSQLESVVRIRTGEAEDSNAIDTGSYGEPHYVAPRRTPSLPLNPDCWLGSRTFSGTDDAAMNCWARR